MKTVATIILLITVMFFLGTSCVTALEDTQPMKTQTYVSGNTSIALIAEQYPIDVYMIVSTSGLTERVCFLAINITNTQASPSISCR